MGFAGDWNYGSADGFKTIANAFYDADPQQLQRLRDLLKDWENQSVRENYLDLLTEAFPHLVFPKVEVQKNWFAEPFLNTHWTDRAITRTSEMEAICARAADRIAELMLDDLAAKRARRECNMMGQCEWNEFAIWVTEFNDDPRDTSPAQINVWIFGPDNVDKEPKDLPFVADSGRLLGHIVLDRRDGPEPDRYKDTAPTAGTPLADYRPSGPIRKITDIRWHRDELEPQGLSKAAAASGSSAQKVTL